MMLLSKHLTADSLKLMIV